MQEGQCRYRHKHQKNRDQTFPDGQHDGFEEIGKHIIAHAHQRDGQEGLEGMEIYDLHAEQNCDGCRQHITGDPGDLLREKITDLTEENASRQGEKHGKPCAYVLELPDMEHQLHKGKGYDKEYRAEPRRVPGAFLGETAGSASGCLRLRNFG